MKISAFTFFAVIVLVFVFLCIIVMKWNHDEKNRNCVQYTCED